MWAACGRFPPGVRPRLVGPGTPDAARAVHSRTRPLVPNAPHMAQRRTVHPSRIFTHHRDSVSRCGCTQILVSRLAGRTGRGLV